MAATTIDDEEDDWMVIECRDPNLIQSLSDSVVLSEIFISTADILFWDLPFILSHDILKVRVNRARLIKHSSYFQSLLGGNFSESSLCSVSIHWSLETFLHILMFIHGCHMEITIYNFLPLCRASLYFGFESLVLDCRNWFSNIIAKKEISGLKLDELIHFWEFSIEHAIDWISALCTSYVARNFMWALSCDAFVDLPFEFLISCVKHPDLAVDSERHLCEALLAWIHENMEQWGRTGTVEDGSSDKLKQMTVITQGWTSILEEIRVNLLPLWFIMGKSRCRYVSRIAKHGISAIMNLLKGFSKDRNYMVDASDQIYMRIRLTEYSKVICETSILNLLGKLNSLQALSICYCIGDVSPSILKNSVPNLRKLKSERMTPWLTNDDLDLLTENCANLIELSLVGCAHLDEDSQQIIASGWPGLISLHLEDCGAVTAKGTAFLLNCKAMEDLLLRHNGPGIQKNFIFDAASRLPMLRSISLDWCDASEGDFDLPNFTDKYALSNVKISRCKLQKCTLDFQYVEAKKRPLHKETLVLEWNSTSLQRTVVKERIA